MSLVIYLGMHAFTRDPNLLMPKGLPLVSLEALQGDASAAPGQQRAVLLERLGTEEAQTLSQWLSQHTDNSAVLLWPQPALYLAATMAAAQTPTQSLESWTQQARQLLSLFRQHRKQVQLVGYVPGQESGPHELAELKSVSAQLPRTIATPLYRLAGAQLAFQDAQVQAVYGYLQASSIVSVEENIATIEEVTSLLECKKEDEQEGTELIVQLDRAQQTLEEQLYQLKQAAADNASLSAQCEKEQKAAKKAAKASTEQQKEKEQITQQLRRLQETLDKKLDELDQVQTDLKKEQTDHQRLQKEHQKQTEQAKQELQSTGAELSSANKENAMVVAELHRVQEVLETNLEEVEAQKARAETFKSNKQDLKDKLATQVEQKKAQKKAYEQALKAQQEYAEQAKEKQQSTLTELRSVQEEKAVVTEEFYQIQEALEVSFEEVEAQRTRAENFKSNKQNLKNKLSTLIEQKKVQQTTHEQALASEKDSVLKAFARAKLLESQLRDVKKELKHQKTLNDDLITKLEKHQKNIEVVSVQHQYREQELQILIQWLRAHANRQVAAVYRYSRAHKKALPEQVQQIESSDYFDASWYSAQYPDVNQADIRPAEHFVKFGALEGRNPGPHFNTEFYLTAYSDVASSGLHPFLHFLRYGMAEQRATTAAQHQLPAPQNITSVSTWKGEG